MRISPDVRPQDRASRVGAEQSEDCAGADARQSDDAVALWPEQARQAQQQEPARKPGQRQD
ncbi:MAG: hypothetical protein MI924_26845 [Chloroflexales bacterium]|nr:hypothetical protein [Chloroflexales bacterium]